MKKFFFILYLIVMVITIAVSIYLYRTQKPVDQAVQNPTAEPADTGPLYAYSTNGERGPLLEPEKDAIQIDPNSGNVLLAENDTYAIEYFAEGQTFSISLLNNNLRASRIAAEADLLNRYGLTQDQACNLNVSVGTVVGVSQEYAGQELGLSFCTDRVDLPESTNDPSPAGSSGGIQPDVQL